MSDEDEIILSELDDDELVQQMHDDLYDGLQEEVVEGVNILLGRGWTPYDVLTKALVEGMTIVGIDFDFHLNLLFFVHRIIFGNLLFLQIF